MYMSPKSVKRRPLKKLKKTRSRCGGTTPTRKRMRTSPSTPKTSPSSPTEPFIPSPGEPSPETQRKELYKAEALLAANQENDRKKRKQDYEEQKARGVNTPPTVLTSREGPIMYIQNEDGTGYREATSSDPNEGIYYISADGLGPEFYKSGLRRVKPLPSLKFGV